MNIGSPIPQWRVPTFIQGTLTFSSLARFQGRPLVLCCTPSLTPTQAWLLEAQFHRFQKHDAVLAAFVSCDIIHDSPWTLPSSDFLVPLLTDPLNRLGRSLGLSRNLAPKRCETLFFDQSSRLEFRLIHDLNLRGLTRVLEINERLSTPITLKQTTKEWQPFLAGQSNPEEMEIHSTVQASP